MYVIRSLQIFLDGYCSTVQGLLDWFEVDWGFTELLFMKIDLCALYVCNQVSANNGSLREGGGRLVRFQWFCPSFFVSANNTFSRLLYMYVIRSLQITEQPLWFLSLSLSVSLFCSLKIYVYPGFRGKHISYLLTARAWPLGFACRGVCVCVCVRLCVCWCMYMYLNIRMVLTYM